MTAESSSPQSYHIYQVISAIDRRELARKLEVEENTIRDALDEVSRRARAVSQAGKHSGERLFQIAIVHVDVPALAAQSGVTDEVMRVIMGEIFVHIQEDLRKRNGKVADEGARQPQHVEVNDVIGDWLSVTEPKPELVVVLKSNPASHPASKVGHAPNNNDNLAQQQQQQQQQPELTFDTAQNSTETVPPNSGLKSPSDNNGQPSVAEPSSSTPSHIEVSNWPGPATSHAFLLVMSLQTIIEKSKSHGNDGVIISYQDLDTLWNGTLELYGKVDSAYATLLQHLPPEERREYMLQTKTVLDAVRRDGVKKDVQADTVPTSQPKKKSKAKKVKETEAVTDHPDSSPLKTAYLKMANGTARALVPIASKKSIVLVSGKDDHSTDEFPPKKKRKTAKGKAKPVSTSKPEHVKPIPDLKMGRTAYTFWHISERKLSREEPSRGIAYEPRLLGAKWKAVSDADKNRFATLSRRDKTREVEQAKAFVANDKDGIERGNERMEELEKEAMEICREMTTLEKGEDVEMTDAPPTSPTTPTVDAQSSTPKVNACPTATRPPATDRPPMPPAFPSARTDPAKTPNTPQDPSTTQQSGDMDDSPEVKSMRELNAAVAASLASSEKARHGGPHN